MIGWSPRFFVRPDSEDQALLCNLAGNAYSGFAVMPLLVGLFAIAGKCTPKEGHRGTPISVNDSLETASEFGDSFPDSCDM
jgi:hypothetical protein